MTGKKDGLTLDSDDIMIPLVFPRDASWKATHGWASKLHWPHPEDEALSACGPRLVLNESQWVPANEVDEVDRCMRPGCRGRWESELRELSRNTKGS